MARSKSLWLLIGWFLAAGAGLLVLQCTGILKHMDLSRLTEWLRESGPLGGLLYIVVYTLRPLVLFPATPLTLYGGYVFGAFWGTIYDIIGAGAGALLSFYITRKWGRHGFQHILRNKKLQSFDQKAEERGFMVVLYMRLMPFFPFDGVSYGAGLSKIRFWDYTWGTLIGIIPGAVVYNVFGASLQDIGSGKFYAAVGMYAVFALVPLLIKRMQAVRARKRA
ncbi:TVP38/TMEM64 family protein [Paenibacillus sp. GCM10023248]|uniref:TVP38/TMEM64 family protein n=1 Tax=Bacillales TaxID=1385 RepID=UPI002378ACBB|nr:MULTISPECIES: TVP38/TMEM64 family protein [Bacillales]MDD9266800.1 TVP38/TMEM64 family protein [Paenibacillus sp. MAHUQ-63]MDR6883745.1 putative membrane protein YdjX (TVP38/TMEM64 family) [Bacillus sp. 3255]